MNSKALKHASNTMYLLIPVVFFLGISSDEATVNGALSLDDIVLIGVFSLILVTAALVFRILAEDKRQEELQEGRMFKNYL